MTAKAAEATGLAEGTPVICGTIDASAEAFSVGVLDGGDMMVMYGSTIFIIQLTDERVRDARLWYAPWMFPGQHASMSGLATSGTLTHWFRDELAKELDPATAFGELAREAALRRRCATGLIFLPYFSGERTPIHDTHAKGTLFGLNLTHKRGDIYRALIEGIAYGTNHIFETYAEVGQPAEAADGGGRRHQEPALAGGDVAYFGAEADPGAEDDRCLLWRCLPRGDRRGGCGPIDHHALEPCRKRGRAGGRCRLREELPDFQGTLPEHETSDG